jgi:hypothetical protein
VEFYKVRPFGFVRDSQLFGSIVAMLYNVNRSKGRALGWKDFFPVEIRPKDADGKDDPETIIGLFKQYNLERGYSIDGRTGESR